MIRLLGGRAGGAERLFCDLANLLDGAGYDVTVVRCDTSPDPIPFALAPTVDQHNLWTRRARARLRYRALDALAAGYRPLRTRSAAAAAVFAPADWLSKNLYFVRALRTYLRTACPDLVISFLPPANTPSLLAGWLTGVAVVPTNHNVPAEDYDSPTRWDQNPIDRALRRRSLAAATRIHVLFPSFAAWFPPELRDRVVAVPNGVAPEFLAPAPPVARRKVVVAAGRLADVKNYAVLVDAWAHVAPRFPDWRVEIHGTGPLEPTLAQQIARLGLTASVRLCGHTSAMREVYRTSEIMAHPAKFEGFGLSAAEALASGCPVVAFADCAGIKEFVLDGTNGVMVDRAGGAPAFAAALARLIEDEPLRARLRAGCGPSLADYTPDAFRARWTRLLSEDLGLRPGPPRANVGGNTGNPR
ncbi:MAG: glycosyltransferase [Kofleriaceae bacterium]